MTAVIGRLAFAGIGRRKLEAALTFLIVAVAAATIATALSVRAVAEEPWQRTFAATRGPHVQAYALPGGDLRPLAEVPGVARAAGPFPGTLTSLRHDGRRYGVRIEARPQSPTPVDRPLVTDGTWLRPGAVVLERSFARGVRARAGDRIALAGSRGPVDVVGAGIAVTTTQQRYPESQPGLAWVLPSTLDVVQPDRGHRSSTLLLRLDEPESAGTFVTRARALYPPHEQIGIDDWRALHADALRHTRTNGVILATFSVLLALAIGFALATTIGGRVLAQSRELGVLKATGFTPVQVASVFMMENLLLGLAAALVGALAGAAVAPAFVMASVELVGAAPQPSFAAARLASAVLIVLAVVATCTFLPSWRRARLTTASILAPQGAGGRSRLRAAGASVGLPPAALVGIKDAFVRPGRASLTALSLALAVASVVGALAMEATFRLAAESVAPTGGPAPLIVDAAGDPIVPEPVPSGGDADRLRPIVYGLDAIMLAVALVTLLTTTLLNVRERSRELGVLKALGFTPRQVVAGVVANQLVLGFVALLVGIPLGVGLFRGAYQAANGSTDGIGSPEWWWLLLLCPAALALFGALAAAAARGFARMPVVEALRYE